MLKREPVKTVQEAAQLLGRHRVTLQDWLRRYREGGRDGLLNQAKRVVLKGFLPGHSQR